MEPKYTDNPALVWCHLVTYGILKTVDIKYAEQNVTLTPRHTATRIITFFVSVCFKTKKKTRDAVFVWHGFCNVFVLTR